MRDCFKDLEDYKRKRLFENVLLSVKRNDPIRQCLRNLFLDAVTPDAILFQILDYLMNEGFPLTREEIYKMNLSNVWLRKAGTIGIENPSYLLSIQKVSSIVTTLNAQNAALLKEYLGVDPYPSMNSSDFLDDLNHLLDLRRINNRRFEKTPEKVNIRTIENENIWVSWNEASPNDVPFLKSHFNTKDLIFKYLGLGFHIGEPMKNYIGLIFDITSSTIDLFRPGWGDGNTYYYWQSIKDKNAKYGYTKAIDIGIENNQPEAVAKNSNFHLDNISEHSFFLI